MSDAFIISRGGGAIKSIKDAVIELDRDSWTYDGGSHAPAVKRVTLRGAELVEWRDYVCVSNPATAAGEYEVAVLGVAAYGGAAHAPWRIEKAAGSISAQPGSVSIQGMAGTTAAVTLTIVGDGAVRVGESELVSGSVEGTKLTLTSVSEGTGTVQIILDEGQNYTGASCEIEVTTRFASKILRENSWETIASVARSGAASELWMVGDTVPFNANGHTFDAAIYDFNHDDLDPTDIYYNIASYNNGSKKAAITFGMKECSPDKAAWGSGNSTYAENLYSSSKARIIGGRFGYDQEVKSVMRTVTKKTGKGATGGAWDESLNLIELPHTAFCLSVSEVGVAKENPYTGSYATGEGSLYQYFKNSNKIPNTVSGTKVVMWCRSPYYNKSETLQKYAMAITTVDKSSIRVVYESYYYAPLFCV